MRSLAIIATNIATIMAAQWICDVTLTYYFVNAAYLIFFRQLGAKYYHAVI